MVCRMEVISKQLDALTGEVAKKTERLENLRDLQRKETDQGTIHSFQLGT